MHAAQKQQPTIKTPFSEHIAKAHAALNTPGTPINQVFSTISAVNQAIDKEAHLFPSSSVLENTAKDIRKLITLLTEIDNNTPTEQQENQLLAIATSLNKDAKEIAQMWRKTEARNMFTELKPLLNAVIAKATQPIPLSEEEKEIFGTRRAGSSRELGQPTIFTSAPDKPVTEKERTPRTTAPKPTKPTTGGPAQTGQVKTPLGIFTGTSTIREQVPAPKGGRGLGGPQAKPPTVPAKQKPGEVAITPEVIAEYKKKTNITMTPDELKSYINMKPEEQEVYVALADNERKQFLAASPTQKRDTVKKKFEVKLGESLTDKQLSDYLALSPAERTKYAITLRKESAERAKTTAHTQQTTILESKTILMRDLTSYFTSAFSKDNLFQLNEKEQRALIDKELPAWQRVINNVREYVTKQAGGQSQLMGALNNCMWVNNLIVKVLTDFYSTEKNITAIKTLIGKPSDIASTASLMGQRQNITEKSQNPESPTERGREQAFPKLKQLKFGFFTTDKAKTEARDMLVTLGEYLLTLVHKIEKEFNALTQVSSKQ